MGNKEQKIAAINHGDKLESLRLEIEEARREWENANRYFQYAYGEDQIDYAIHSIITAEKRYGMLIRKAKLISTNWPSWGGVMR